MHPAGVERVRYLMISPAVLRSGVAQGFSNEGSLGVSLSSQFWCSLEHGRKETQCTGSFASSLVGRGQAAAAVRHLSSAKARAEGCQEFLLFIFPSLTLGAGAQCHPHVSYYFTRLP